MAERYFKNRRAEIIAKETSVLYPYCRGRGIDVGCGAHKIHPAATGIDIVARGTKFKKCKMKKGILDRQGAFVCQADIQAAGDNLFMFKDNELDYVVSSHNLEHYLDTIKTLREWKRVLKPGGILGIILPDDIRGSSMYVLCHKHCFTPESFKNLVQLIGGLKIIKLERMGPSRSFVCVMKKRKG